MQEVNASSYMDYSSRKPSPESTKRGEQEQEEQLATGRSNNTANPNLAGHLRATNQDHESMIVAKKSLSKTEPLHLKEDQNRIQPQETHGQPQESGTRFNNASRPKQSFSPDSYSKKSLFRPDDYEHSNKSDNSSMEAELGTPKRRNLNPMPPRRQNTGNRGEPANPSGPPVRPQFPQARESTQGVEPKKLSTASDMSKLRDNVKKKSKIPPRRLQSILKKSKTNKNSKDTSPSRDSKRVQFNRYKQVLTFYMDNPAN